MQDDRHSVDDYYRRNIDNHDFIRSLCNYQSQIVKTIE